MARHLKSKGIVIYNGKGVLQDRMFQIAHIGALRKNDTRDALREVQTVMRQAATIRPRQLLPAENVTRAVA